METNIVNFVGIDISKLTIDVTVIMHSNFKLQSYQKFENAKAGIIQLQKWLFNELALQKSETVFCMEHTGLYSKIPAIQLTRNGNHVWMELALHIKRSIGLQRGANDKVSSARIAEYAFKNKDQIKIWQAPSESLLIIQELLALRDRLIGAKKSLIIPVNEHKDMKNTLVIKTIEKYSIKSIRQIEKNISEIDQQLDNIVSMYQEIKHPINLVTSIKGIGKITALNLLVYTNNFQQYTVGKQLACYCGVVPFAHKSGTSVNKKPRVSYMANKNLKRLLHLCALAAIRNNPELKQYYERKVSEGKNRMSVINAVRNKLVLRIAAVIKRGAPYVDVFVS
jgi:Transposase and inactivated derivatives